MPKIKIKGDTWHCEVLDTEEFSRKYGDDNAAVCVPSSKCLAFDEDELSLVCVIHEITHAYWSYQRIGSASLSIDQMEEVSCELMANDGIEILKQARSLYKKLRRS